MPKLFNDADFYPGKVICNYLELDPSQPLTLQVDQLYEGLAWIEFANGISIHIGWKPSMSIDGHFYVDLGRGKDDDCGWNPFLRQKCDTVEELKVAVHDLVLRATTWRPEDDANVNEGMNG